MKRVFLVVLLLVTCVVMFTGCDPVLPAENIAASCTNPLTVGDSAAIELTYPNIEDTAIASWSDPTIRVISGEDLVKISGLTITALKPGVALLEISVTANCTYLGMVIDRTVFTTELEVTVV